MKAMIIPGNQNTQIETMWYPYVKNELQKLEVEVIAKNMPDPDIARKKYWLPFIEKQMSNESEVILIGHSSGAVAIMRYLENHKIVGAVLVGACYTDLNDQKEKLSGYYDQKWHWDTIKKNAKWIIEFASVDDPFINIDEMRYIRDMLATEYHEYKNKGHFMQNEFPELIAALNKKILNSP